MTQTAANGAASSQTTIAPGAQGVFAMDYDPRTVNVQNPADFDGQFLYVWIYASATPVTPAAVPIASQANQTLRPPPPDSGGGAAKTLVIYNTGGATLTCTERTT